MRVEIGRNQSSGFEFSLMTSSLIVFSYSSSPRLDLAFRDGDTHCFFCGHQREFYLTTPANAHHPRNLRRPVLMTVVVESGNDV